MELPAAAIDNSIEFDDLRSIHPNDRIRNALCEIFIQKLS